VINSTKLAVAPWRNLSFPTVGWGRLEPILGNPVNRDGAERSAKGDAVVSASGRRYPSCAVLQPALLREGWYLPNADMDIVQMMCVGWEFG
jgi:hypothetical protein